MSPCDPATMAHYVHPFFVVFTILRKSTSDVDIGHCQKHVCLCYALYNPSGCPSSFPSLLLPLCPRCVTSLCSSGSWQMTIKRFCVSASGLAWTAGGRIEQPSGIPGQVTRQVNLDSQKVQQLALAAQDYRCSPGILQVCLTSLRGSFSGVARCRYGVLLIFCILQQSFAQASRLVDRRAHRISG